MRFPTKEITFVLLTQTFHWHVTLGRFYQIIDPLCYVRDVFVVMPAVRW
jgi:hypothetical protein